MKILIVQTAFLGDTVLSTPVIGAVRARFPEAEIWFLGTPGGVELVRRDPFLAGVIPFDKRGADAGLGGLWALARRLRAHRFDRVYALQRSVRTAVLLRLARIPERVGFRSARLAWLYTERIDRPTDRHDVERNVAILGATPSASELELRLFPPSRSEVRSEVRAALPPARQYVALAPGSKWRTKRWDAEGYATVARAYRERGHAVVVVGSPEEAEVCAFVATAGDALNLAGKTDVAEFAAVIGEARLLVCNDSVALHIGSALKVPTVAVFCATSPRFGFGPWRNKATVVEHTGLACKPCRRHGSERCPTGTESCMRDVPPDRVLAAAAELEGAPS
jgi:heptosyltransferase-2